MCITCGLPKWFLMHFGSCSTYRSRYSNVVTFPFCFFSSITLHWLHFLTFKVTSNTCADTSAIAETTPLFAIQPQLLHVPSKLVGMSTISDGSVPYSFRINTLALSAAIFMFSSQSWSAFSSQNWICSLYEALQTGDESPKHCKSSINRYVLFQLYYLPIYCICSHQKLYHFFSK